MTHLTKEQRLFLSKISKEPLTQCSSLLEEQLEMIEYLNSLGFLKTQCFERSFENPTTGETIVCERLYESVSISEKGKSYFSERNHDILHFLIPVAISVIALLISAISLLLQLLL